MLSGWWLPNIPNPLKVPHEERDHADIADEQPGPEADSAKTGVRGVNGPADKEKPQRAAEDTAK
jgi:hypothetical protein